MTTNNKTTITALDWANIHHLATNNYQASNLIGTRDDVKKHLDYKTLFAEIESEGVIDHDSSILSPAVYFVDLMRLIEQKITSVPSGLSHLERRPDLLEIELDAKNTSTEIPYLEIVNNVLRQHLAEKPPDNKDLTKKELEHVKDERILLARKRLTTNYYHFKPPVHIPLLQLRTYLAHFDIKLSDIYQAFGLADDNAALISERLNLLPNDLDHIAMASHDLSDVNEKYGIDIDSLFDEEVTDRSALNAIFSKLEFSSEQLQFLLDFKAPGDDLVEKLFTEDVHTERYDNEQILDDSFIKLNIANHVSVRKGNNGIWNTIDEPNFGRVVNQVAVFNGCFFAACSMEHSSEVGLCYSEDHGETWVPAEPVSLLRDNDMQFLTTVSGRIFAGAFETTFSSEDGKTWKKVADFCMEQAVEFGDQIFAKSFRSRDIYVSNNRGQNWQKLDIEKQVLKNLINFDYLARFIRLSFCLECTFDDLLQQLKSIGATLLKTKDENFQDLKLLANLQYYQQKIDVSVSVMCSLVSDLSVEPSLNTTDSMSAFDSVFNNPSFYCSKSYEMNSSEEYLHSKKQALTWKVNSTNLESQGIRSSLIAALNLNNDELQAIINHIDDFALFRNELFFYGELYLFVESLSRLYRFSKIAKIFEISIPEYLVLLEAITDSGEKCLDNPEVLNLHDLSIVDYWVDLLKKTGLNAWQLLLLKGKDLNAASQQYFDPGFNGDSLDALIPSLYSLIIPKLIQPESFSHCTDSPKQADDLFIALVDADFLGDVSPDLVDSDGVDSSKLGKIIRCPFGVDNKHLGKTQEFSSAQIIAALPDSLNSFKKDGNAVSSVVNTLNDALNFQIHTIILKLADIFDQDERIVTNASRYLNAEIGGRSAYDFLASDEIGKIARLQYLSKAFEMSVAEHTAVLSDSDIFDSMCDGLDSIHTLASIFYFDKQFNKSHVEKNDVVELLSLFQNGTNKSLALFIGWHENEIDDLGQYTKGEGSLPKVLAILNQSRDLTKKLGIDIHMLIHLCNLHEKGGSFEQYSPIANSFLAVLKSKYSEQDDFEKIFDPMTNHLNECERDALVRLLMHQLRQEKNSDIATHFDNFESLQNLSDYLLIDVEMSGLAKISFVKQGMNTLQRYIQRCHTGLEVNGEVSCPVSDEEWKWRSHYRLWEANRKVFLYPENYLDPGLRKIKTPVYTELENALMQGEVSEETVTQAYIQYFDKLDELVNLKVVDSCEARVTHPGAIEGEDTIFYLAKTDSDPAVYYYRSAVVESNLSNGLEAWEPQSNGIPNSSVYDLMHDPDGSALFASSLKEVYRFDGTDEWKPDSNGILESQHLVSSPDGSLFAAGRQLYVKEPRGEWTQLWNARQSINALILTKGGYLLAGTDSGGFASFIKLDGGWSLSSILGCDFNQYNIVYVFGMGVDNKTLFAGTEAGVVRSLDNGVTWETEQVMPSDVRVNTFLTWTKVKMIVAGTSNGIFYSWDNGENWNPNYERDSMLKGKNITALALSPNGKTLFAGTSSDGVFVLQDDDETWSKASEGMNEKEITTLLVSSDNKKLYAGTANGLYCCDGKKGITAWRPWQKIPLSIPVDSVACRYAENRLHLFWLEETEKTDTDVGIYSSKKSVLRNGTVKFSYHNVSGNWLPPQTLKKNPYDLDSNKLNEIILLDSDPYGSGVNLIYSKDSKVINVPSAISPELANAWNKDTNKAYVEQLRNTLIQQGLPHLFSTERQSKFDLTWPYSIYYREIFFHIPFLIADTLNHNQHFENAQKWYHYIFNPVLTNDKNKSGDKTPYWRYQPFKHHELETLVDIRTTHPQEFKIYTDDPFDPHAIAGLRLGAYEKAIVMKYIDNLLDWGDYLFSQDSWESIVEAMLLYTQAQDLLGKKPKPKPALSKAVKRTTKRYDQLSKAGTLLDPFHVADTKEFPVPPNTQFASYWDLAEDRLFKIRHSMNIKGVTRQLALFQPPIDPTQLVKALSSGAGGSFNSVLGQPIPYYRFSVMIQQAKSITATLSQLGSSILSALEKKDAEQLSLLRSTHEKSILNLTTKLKQKQIDDAAATIDSLNASLKSAQLRKSNYKKLIGDGLISQEKVSLSMTEDALVAQDVAHGIRGAAVAAHLIPTVFGFADGCFQPGESVSEAADLSDAIGAIFSQQAGLATLQGQNARRKSEWELQQVLAGHDVDQINAQIKGALIKQDVAQKDLDMHLKSIKNANENEDLLKTKFSNHDLYQWMLGRITSIYFQTYKMACDIAKQAESAYQYERDTNNTLITANYWDSLKKGLLAGEALTLGLNQLEKAYMDNHERELEIEKTISLRQIDPSAFLNLREKGICSFSFDELLFDRDFPGHYCRKIKSIAITIPAIVGPYQNVQATLIQQLNRTVLMNDLETVSYLLPESQAENDSNNTITPSDKQLRTDSRQKQKIALSSGVKDSGVFELNFNDQRYLPFEGTGAISDWELRMPKAANRLDFDSISDVIINLRYTAKEGGDHFRDDVVKLPAIKQYRGTRLFNVRQEFSADCLQSHQNDTELKIEIGTEFFPVNIIPKTFELGEIVFGDVEQLKDKNTVMVKVEELSSTEDDTPARWLLTLPKIESDENIYLLVNFSGDLDWKNLC